MFRLFKLTAYLLLGYALYELVLGVLEGSGGMKPQASSETPAAAPRPPRRASGRSSGGGSRSQATAQPRTLAGSGSTVIDGSDGSHRRTNIGRGVVSR